MKAIILTNTPISNSEKEILKETHIFKLALNHHAAEFSPNERIITDYVLSKIYQKFPEKIISVRDRLSIDSDRVEYFEGTFKGSTIVAGLDYLISKNYNEILIVGNNQVHNQKFRNEINYEIDKIRGKISIYQYSHGDFNLPIKTITEFCE